MHKTSTNGHSVWNSKTFRPCQMTQTKCNTKWPYKLKDGIKLQMHQQMSWNIILLHIYILVQKLKYLNILTVIAIITLNCVSPRE